MIIIIIGIINTIVSIIVIIAFLATTVLHITMVILRSVDRTQSCTSMR